MYVDSVPEPTRSMTARSPDPWVSALMLDSTSPSWGGTMWLSSGGVILDTKSTALSFMSMPIRLAWGQNFLMYWAAYAPPSPPRPMTAT